MNKIKKIIVTTVILIAAILFIYGESRRFYCTTDGICVTVWKTYNNVCYIIPNKYWGLIAPTDNFITTTNTSTGMVLILKDNNTLLVDADDNSKIVNNTPKKLLIIDYKLQQKQNDSLYTYFDSTMHVRRYKKNINLISLPINDMGAL